MSTRAPRKLSIAVALLTLAITVGLTVLSWQVTTRSEERLLARQLAQVGTLLGNQSAVLEVTLADVGQVAVNTGANPAAFARFAARELEETGQSLSLWRGSDGPAQQLTVPGERGGCLSLWRVTDGRAEQLTVQGVPPLLPADGAAALAGLRPTGQLTIL